MKRQIRTLAGGHFDVLVIGGGIHGAAALREAALRGLNAALLDKGDFCSATSANSLKTIHGGLRYLQQANLARLRQSARERMILMRIAPHLVHPLRCVMPTRPTLMKSRPALAAGLLANRILTADLTRLSDPAKAIPHGRTLSGPEWRRLMPALAIRSDTGAAVWYDATAYNTERLVIGMVRAAVSIGAQAANYVEVTGFLRAGNRITGVRARDLMDGHEFEIEARVVVNNAGPWLGKVLALPGGCPVPTALDAAPVLALNVVLRRCIEPDLAVGLPASRHVAGDSRLFFYVPWRGRTMAGTSYRLYPDSLDRLAVPEADVAALVRSLAAAWPSAGITLADVARVHAGILPGIPRPGKAEPDVIGQYRIVNHARAGGPEGLLSVMGVKYTTARDVAARTLDHVMAALGRPRAHVDSDRTPLPGGDIPDFGTFLDRALGRKTTRLSEPVLTQLACNYGTEYSAVLDLARQAPELGEPVAAGSEVIAAEAVFAAREEMAETLSDAVLRRSQLASAGLPGDTAMETFAGVMAREKGWDASRVASEIAAVKREAGIHAG